MELTERRIFNFWRKIHKTDSCWLWVGAKSGGGYGKMCFSVDGKNFYVKAHHISYLIHYGSYVKDNGTYHGVCVLHKCDTPSCVNPEHLYLGSQLENIRDKVSKNRSYRPSGEKNPKAKLSEEKVMNIKKSKLNDKELSGLYKVDKTTINSIRTGKTWN